MRAATRVAALACLAQVLALRTLRYNGPLRALLRLGAAGGAPLDAWPLLADALIVCAMLVVQAVVIACVLVAARVLGKLGARRALERARARA